MSRAARKERPPFSLRWQRPLLRVLARGPRVTAHPLVGPRLEGQGFGEVEIALVPQVVGEEASLDLAELGGGVAPEVDGPEAAPRSVSPAAVVPWPDDEEVLFRRVLGLEGLIDRQRPVEILLVEQPPTLRSGC